jgi:hypothetical protein
MRMVESVDDVRDFDARAMVSRAKWKECGERLKQAGGDTLGSLKHTGHMPKLITADGSSWRRPAWHGRGWYTALVDADHLRTVDG